MTTQSGALKSIECSFFPHHSDTKYIGNVVCQCYNVGRLTGMNLNFITRL